MPDNNPIKVLRSSGGVESWDAAKLKWDLASDGLLDREAIDKLVNKLERNLLINDVRKIETATIKSMVHEIRANGLDGLAVERLVDVAFGKIETVGREETEGVGEDVLAFPDFEDDGDEFAAGPAAPLALMDQSFFEVVGRADPELADFGRAMSAIKVHAINSAVAFYAEDLSRDVGEAMGLNTAQMTLLASTLASPVVPLNLTDEDMQKFGQLLRQLGDALLGTNAMVERSYRGYIEGAVGRERPGSRVDFGLYGEELDDGQYYVKVGSLERQGPTHPLRASRTPLYCHSTVDPDHDDLDGAEITYQTYPSVNHLFTDDYPRAGYFVRGSMDPHKDWDEQGDGGWNLEPDDLLTDLPPLYALAIPPNEITEHYFAWQLLDRETTNSVIDKIAKASADALEKNKDKLVEKAEELAEGTINDLSSFVPAEIPDFLKNGAKSAVKLIAGYLIGIVVELLDTDARPFPQVVLAHRTISVAGFKPLSIVKLSSNVPSSDGKLEQSVRLRRMDKDGKITDWNAGLPTGVPSRGHEVWWVGASETADELTYQMFKNARYGGADGLVWRPSAKGFGALMRQKNMVRKNGKYVVALRADVRKYKHGA